MENVIHARPAIQIGQPVEGDFVTSEGFVYRSMSRTEWEHAASVGEFLPNPTGKSRGGRANVKHWVRGGVQFYSRVSITNSGLIVVCVAEDKISTDKPVRFTDATIVF